MIVLFPRWQRRGKASHFIAGFAQTTCWSSLTPGKRGPAKQSLDFPTHGAMARASRRGEPRPINLDAAASFGPDRSRRTQVAHHTRHRRSSHTEYLRQRFLGDGKHILLDAVAKMEQPACHSGFDRMQCITGGTELKLRQHRPDVKLHCVPDRGASIERRLKPRGADS